jgi:hypothetical protein
MGEYIWSLAFDASGEVLAVGFAARRIAVLSVNTLETVAKLEVRFGVSTLAFASDGTLVADQNGELHLWSTRAIGKGVRPPAAARADDGDLDERLRRIRQKIARRQLLMNEPASCGELEAFERRHAIRLPEGYCRFVLEIANGGAGPGGTFLQLGEAPDGRPELADWAFGRLGKPFPLNQEWCWEDDASASSERVAAADHGRLLLVNQGCGMFWGLIVTGPARNEMWHFCDVGVFPCQPRRDFLSWLEYWLDGGHFW